MTYIFIVNLFSSKVTLFLILGKIHTKNIIGNGYQKRGRHSPEFSLNAGCYYGYLLNFSVTAVT